ncbi:MAG TPA: thiamine-phosphate kinase [Candidatus Binatia bacterium]|nr:thiamine-phosphate kinase [Candidatus Binatia bacterium]
MSATRETNSAGFRRFDAGGATLEQLGEAELLRRLTSIALEAGAGAELVLPAGDDAAVWRVAAGMDVVLSQDAIVEGEDFRRGWTDPEEVGERALHVAISDLAGMGAQPRLGMVTLCASPATQVEDLLAVQRGLCGAALGAGCRVAGGDVSAIQGPLVVDVSVLGTVPPDRALRRDRGRPGDLLVVTGRLGGAAAGLRILTEDLPATPPARERWLARQLRPTARIAEGLALTDLGVACAGDLSDGLLVDVGRIIEASRCGAELWVESLPVDAELPQVLGDRWLEAAIGGGEDFELVAAVAPERLPAVLDGWGADLVPLQVVGRLDLGPGLRLRDREGGAAVPLPPILSRHFRQP